MIFFRYNKHIIARVLFTGMISVTLLPILNAKAEEAPSKAVNIYAKIAAMHLPSIANKELVEQALAEELAKTNAERIEKKSPYDQTINLEVPSVGEAEKMRLLYEIFNTANNNQAQPQQNVIDENVVNDLNLFCGEKSTLENHLFGKIDRTQTALGKIELQCMLAEPLTDITALQQRQAIVQKLISDENLFCTLDAQLKNIKTSESDLIWFWKQLDAELQAFFDQVYINGDGFSTPTSTKNKNTTVMQAWHGLQTIGIPAYATVVTPAMMLLVGGIITYAKNQGAIPFSNCMKDYFKTVTLQNNPSIMQSLISTYFAAIIGLGIYQSLSKAVLLNNVANNIHGHMIPVGNYTETLDDIFATISTSPELASVFPEYKELAAFNTAINDETQSLVDALKTETFKGEPSIFSLRGRVLASFKKMFAGKNHFIGSMQIIGKLDAYLSIAKLYKEHANNSNARYCFASYEAASTPHLKAIKFWVPMLNPDAVVTNNIEMGNINPRNIIVTGPNAGGKSTVLKSIIISVILAQTIGIAPANEMTLTPFGIIKSYMNIADTTGSASLFQAEMRRTQGLIDSIKALLPGQFAFIIMDEIFTGTNHREGQAGAFGVVKKIANNPSCICLFATHFKKLTELESTLPKAVANKKVTVIKNADSSFTFPYKLEAGITDQAIALDLLAQQGFDAEVVQAAQDALA
jgi:DNA mismatch repair protein MutS